MKFYLIEVATGDAKITGKAVYEYDTEREAEASFHQKLATAMKSDLYDSVLLRVINSENGIYPNLEKKYINPEHIQTETIAE